MVAYSGNDPVTVVDIAETFASKGLLVKYGAAGIINDSSSDRYPTNRFTQWLNQAVMQT